MLFRGSCSHFIIIRSLAFIFYPADTLARHEYAKHGSCQGGSQEEYFRLGIDMTMQYATPDVISRNVGQVVSVSDIQVRR